MISLGQELVATYLNSLCWGPHEMVQLEFPL